MYPMLATVKQWLPRQCTNNSDSQSHSIRSISKSGNQVVQSMLEAISRAANQKSVHFLIKAPNLEQQLLNSYDFILDKYTEKIGIFN